MSTGSVCVLYYTFWSQSTAELWKNEYFLCNLQIDTEPRQIQMWGVQIRNLLIFADFLVYKKSYFASRAIVFPTVIAAYQKQLCLIGNLYLRDQAWGCSISSFCFYFWHSLFVCVCSLIPIWAGASAIGRAGLGKDMYCNLLQGLLSTFRQEHHSCHRVDDKAMTKLYCNVLQYAYSHSCNGHLL
jgi:hypothetical protein